MELFYNLFLIVNDICSRYVVQYKDGNPADLHYKNLELKQLKQVARHTCAASVKLTNGLKITSKDPRKSASATLRIMTAQ